jgi:hypothetical protein
LTPDLWWIGENFIFEIRKYYLIIVIKKWKISISFSFIIYFEKKNWLYL